MEEVGIIAHCVKTLSSEQQLWNTSCSNPGAKLDSEGSNGETQRTET